MSNIAQYKRRNFALKVKNVLLIFVLVGFYATKYSCFQFFGEKDKNWHFLVYMSFTGEWMGSYFVGNVRIITIG